MRLSSPALLILCLAGLEVPARAMAAPAPASRRATVVPEYGYRYYAPDRGKWICRDPIGERGGINLYGMVGNDSVNLIDTDGRQVFMLRPIISPLIEPMVPPRVIPIPVTPPSPIIPPMTPPVPVMPPMPLPPTNGPTPSPSPSPHPTPLPDVDPDTMGPPEHPTEGLQPGEKPPNCRNVPGRSFRPGQAQNGSKCCYMCTYQCGSQVIVRYRRDGCPGEFSGVGVQGHVNPADCDKRGGR